VFTWINGPIRLRQGGTGHPYFKEFLHNVQKFLEKDKKRTMLPQAKMAFGEVHV
jgi:hypothetical protein